MEAPYEEADYARAIDAMGKGKSPGPDGLPAEFYQEFRDMLTPHLCALFEEAEKLGQLA